MADIELPDRAASGFRSVPSAAAFLLGVCGFAAPTVLSLNALGFAVIGFISGIAGALVASGSARVWAPLLGCWAGLAGNLILQFISGQANGTWSLFVPFALAFLAPPVVAGAAIVMAIRSFRQL